MGILRWRAMDCTFSFKMSSAEFFPSMPSFRVKVIENVLVTVIYRIYPKYWYILSIYHTCPKIEIVHCTTSKLLLYVWQTMSTMIRLHILQHLIWVYTVYKDLSVPVLRVITVVYIVGYMLSCKHLLCITWAFSRYKVTESQLEHCAILQEKVSLYFLSNRYFSA